MATTKKMAILKLNASALREMLQLPEEAECVRLEMDSCRGAVRIFIEGAGWDIEEGMPIVPTHATCKQTLDADGRPYKLELDWGFPDGNS